MPISLKWRPLSICGLRTIAAPTRPHTAAEYATQLALVAAGLGAAVLPRLGRDPLPKGVTVVPAEPSLRRHVYAAWRTHATRSNVIRAAVEAFQLAASKLNTAPTLRTRRRSSRAGTR